MRAPEGYLTCATLVVGGFVGFMGARVIDQNFVGPEPFQDRAKVERCAKALGQEATFIVSQIPNDCEPFKASFPYESKSKTVYTPDKDAQIEGSLGNETGSVKRTIISKSYQLMTPNEFSEKMAAQAKEQPHHAHTRDVETLGIILGGLIGTAGGYMFESRQKGRSQRRRDEKHIVLTEG
jgi:hypothetical protein